MKNVQLYGYVKNNLGDDLFISSFVKNYPNINFYLKVQETKYVQVFNELINLHIVEEIDISNIDICVYIAGSIFMEKGTALQRAYVLLEFIKQCKANNKEYLFISSNFGPYITDEYVAVCKDIFTNCSDICFRDMYSYNMFKDISTVRYAPDFLFSLNIDEYMNKIIPNTIGISIINMDIRDSLKEYSNNYYMLLINNVKQYIKQKMKVTLFSFCEYEGDSKTIDIILDGLTDEELESVNMVKYTGNIKEFLNIYSSMEYMICTRFHSMVLSYILKQKYYCITYSDKITNVIFDFNLCEEYIDITNINECKTIKKEKFNMAKEEAYNQIISKSKEQIKSFENIIV